MPISLYNGKLFIVSNRPQQYRVGIAGVTPPDDEEPPPTGVPPTYGADASWMGITSSGGAHSQAIDLCNDGPFNLIRSPIEGNSVQDDTTGVISFGSIDTRFNNIKTAGHEVLCLITYSSAYCSGFANDKRVPTFGSAAWDTFVDRWSDFALACVQRYHKDGNNKAAWVTNTKYIKYFEIWNEWNHHVFWQINGDGPVPSAQAPNAEAYTELMSETYKKIKAAVPAAIVLQGGFAVKPIPEKNGGRRLKSYDCMHDMLDIYYPANFSEVPTGGWAKVGFDGVCHHPYQGGRFGNVGQSSPALTLSYNSVSNSFTHDMPRIYKELVDYGFPTVKTWGTESGRGWSNNATTGYGYRGASQTTKGERDIYSPQEAYDLVKKATRCWQGAEAWLTGSDMEPYPSSMTLAEQTATRGPLVYHTARDFDIGTDNDAYETPGVYEEHYGLYNMSNALKVPGSNSPTYYFMTEYT